MEDMQPGQQPGQLIVPHDPSQPQVQGGDVPQPTQRPTEVPEPTPSPSSEPETAALPPAPVLPAETASDAPAGWEFHQEASGGSAPQQPLPDDISWTASEFIEHHKSVGWYGMLALVGAVASAVIYLLTRDKVTTGIIVFVLIAFGIYAARKPRTQQYGVSRQGLQVGNKMYGFQDFKTFSIAEEGATVSIVFMPLKRFMPPLTMYVAPDIEEQVVDYLTDCLPFEQHKADAVDSLLRRIHF